MTALPPPTAAAVALANPIIRFAGVSKFFGELVAVSDVTFDLGPGVTALLGPNDAGKSTALRLLTGQATPSKGEVRILGADPRRDRRVAGAIGVAPQQETLYESQTALEFVRLGDVLQEVDGADAAARRVLAQVELDADESRTIAAYSKGMRQRVKPAQAIVHDPQVIGSRVLVISKGRLAAERDFRAIRALMNDRPRELHIRSDRARALAVGLLELPIVRSVVIDGDVVVVETNDMLGFAGRLRRSPRASTRRSTNAPQ